MDLRIAGAAAFAYTGSHAFDAAKPTLLFVHGAGLDHSSFALQSRYFAYHGWNVLALDLPAHGRSRGPALDSIGVMADWVLKWLVALEVPVARVVGHSMGALVALECAARSPRRIERIALLGVAYPMKVSEAFLDAARRNDPAAFDMETIWGHALDVPLARNPNPGMWMHGDTLARLRRLEPGVLYSDLRACHEFTFDFARVACPVLLVLGRRDVMTPVRNASALIERLANARQRVLESSGHSLMSEAPDATLDALIRFLGEDR